MRLRSLLLALLVAAPAGAQTAGESYAIKNLQTSKDSRVRAQAAVLLGASHNAMVVQPLCQAMNDPETIVKAAAAKALGDIGLPDAIPCLKGNSDSDNTVKTAVYKAIQQLTHPCAGAKKGTMCVLIEALKDETGDISASDLKLAADLIAKKLLSMGYSVAPPGVDKDGTSLVVRSKGLKGWWLKVKVMPNGNGNGLKLDLLALTLPDQAIKGNVNVGAAVKGGSVKPSALFAKMVPKLIDDAASEFEWSTP